MVPVPVNRIAIGLLAEATIRELKNALAGSVVGAGDPSYETARRVWNDTVDKRPAMVVRMASIEDVGRTVRLARREVRPIAMRGGAHSVAGFSTRADGIVIDLAQLKVVQVDVDSRRVAGGGTRWKDFDAATQQHGLATVGGLVSSTGRACCTLGGYGHLARKQGLACDNQVSVELVTADGSVVHASDSENPELFWALRGRGNFGIVTRVDLGLGPVVLGGVLEQRPDIPRYSTGRTTRQIRQRVRSITVHIDDTLVAAYRLNMSRAALPGIRCCALYNSSPATPLSMRR